MLSMYEKRRCWADTFLRGNFLGGMSTTQRCEKMHSILKTKVTEKISLCYFVRGLDLALSWLQHRESQDEFITKSTKPQINATNMEGLES